MAIIAEFERMKPSSAFSYAFSSAIVIFASGSRLDNRRFPTMSGI
jgi:hypothetical protein